MLALLLMPTSASAHSLTAADAWLVVPWFTIAAFYAFGIGRLWARAGFGAGAGTAAAAAFAFGWVALGAALLSPLDSLADASLSAHMAQHMILLAVVPPLVVAGKPVPVLLGIFPPRAARFLARPAHWRDWPTGLGAATLGQLIVLWGWHAPLALEWAARSDAVHWLMHASFVVAGFLFWSALWRSARGGIAIAVTMGHMGLLAALMTFSPRPWYAAYPDLVDQQLAGLIMWVPGAVPYLVGGLALVARWLRRGKLATEHTSPSNDS
ncbi:MAG: cytochrome c oxidase assembly protein [Gammaproteobacteria bacterium]